MTNRFSHITSKRQVSDPYPNQKEQHFEAGIKGKPTTTKLGKGAYETLISLFSEERETSTSPLGVFVANSTKRNLLRQIEEIFKP